MPSNVIGSACHITSCFRFCDGEERVVTVSRGDGTPYCYIKGLEERSAAISSALWCESLRREHCGERETFAGLCVLSVSVCYLSTASLWGRFTEHLNEFSPLSWSQRLIYLCLGFLPAVCGIDGVRL